MATPLHINWSDWIADNYDQLAEQAKILCGRDYEDIFHDVLESLIKTNPSIPYPLYMGYYYTAIRNRFYNAVNSKRHTIQYRDITPMSMSPDEGIVEAELTAETYRLFGASASLFWEYYLGTDNQEIVAERNSISRFTLSRLIAPVHEFVQDYLHN